MRSASYGLRHPASASCLGRHMRLAGRCPNNSSLFPPLAAVVVIAAHHQRKIYFIFAILENLWIFQNCFLTGGGATASGISRNSPLVKMRLERSAELVGAKPFHLLTQTALPLKSPTGAFIATLRKRGRSKREISNNYSADYAQSNAERIQIVLFTNKNSRPAGGRAGAEVPEIIQQTAEWRGSGHRCRAAGRRCFYRRSPGA